MTPEQLEASRLELGLNKAEMAQLLRTPYRTYVDWERGDRRIPGVAEVAVELMVFNLRKYMATSFPGAGTRKDSMPTVRTCEGAG